MRESAEAGEGTSKKCLYPNYIIIPAAGSLIDKLPAGTTLDQADKYLDHVLKIHGARRKEQG